MDEVFQVKTTFQAHEDTLYVEKTQPTENLIYENNQKLRNDNLLNDLSFGRQVAEIPMIVYIQAIKAGYELNAPDPEIRKHALIRFLNSDVGKLCRVGKT